MKDLNPELGCGEERLKVKSRRPAKCYGGPYKNSVKQSNPVKYTPKQELLRLGFLYSKRAGRHELNPRKYVRVKLALRSSII